MKLNYLMSPKGSLCAFRANVGDFKITKLFDYQKSDSVAINTQIFTSMA